LIEEEVGQPKDAFCKVDSGPGALARGRKSLAWTEVRIYNARESRAAAAGDLHREKGVTHVVAPAVNSLQKVDCE
jgi:hypothetical protein